MDDFDRAVMCAYVDVATSDLASAAAARDYLKAVSDSDDVFRTVLDRLHVATVERRHDSIKFVCLNIAQRAIEQRYADISEEDKSYVRTSLLIFVRDVLPQFPLPRHIKARVSTCLTAIAKFDFPTAWPSFFADFISFLPQGPEPAELFLQTLKTLEEDIIQADSTMSTGLERPKMDAVIAMAIKDAMRAGPLPAIVDATHTIITTYQASHPALALDALTVLAVYVEWIELDLVVNDKFFPLLFELLSAEQLRTGAVAVLSAIASKGMPRAKRIQLLEQMNFVEIIEKFDLTQDEEPAEYDGYFKTFVCAMARFTGALLIQLASCFDEVLGENVAVDPSYPGSSLRSKPRAAVGSGAARATQSVFGGSGVAGDRVRGRFPTYEDFIAASPPEEVALVQTNEALLLRTASCALSALRNPQFEVAMQVGDPIADLVSLFKYVGVMSNERDAVLQKTLEAVAPAWQYPEWHSTQGVTLNADTRDDREARFEQYRGNKIERIFRALTLVHRDAAVGYTLTMLHTMLAQVGQAVTHNAPSDTVGYAGRFLAEPLAFSSVVAAVEPGSADAAATASSLSTAGRTAVSQLPYAPIESIVHMIFVLGDAVGPGIMAALGTVPWAPALASLFLSPLTYHPNVLVATSLYESLARYHRVLEVYPHVLPEVLQIFLDDRGICSPVVELRSAAAYQLTKTIRAFTSQERIRAHLLPFVPSLADALIDVVSSVLSRGAQRGLKGRVSFPDAVNLCESLSLLSASSVAGPTLSPELHQRSLMMVLEPLTALVAAAPAAMPALTDVVVKRAGQLIQALLTIVKNMSLNEAAVDSTKQLLAHSFAQVMSAYELAPEDEFLRAKTVAYLHVIVEVMRAHAFEALGPALAIMLQYADERNICRVVELTNQLMARFGAAFEPVLTPVFGPLAHKIFACLDAVSAPLAETAGIDLAAALSQQRAARVEMVKVYFLFLRGVLSEKLDAVLLTHCNDVPLLCNTVLQHMTSAQHPMDLGGFKTSVLLLRLFLRFWVENGLLATLPGEQVGQIITVVSELVTLPTINDKDVSFTGLLREVVNLYRLLFDADADFAQALYERWAPDAGAGVATAFVAAVTSTPFSVEAAASQFRNALGPIRAHK
jgi:exportin-T